MNLHKVKDWTLDEVAANEDEYSKHLLTILEFGKKKLLLRDYQSAESAFLDVVFGLKHFATLWPDYYQSYYYANYYILFKIYAFGLKDREMAETALKMTRLITLDCINKGNDSSAMARRDLVVIQEIYDEFQKGCTLSQINSLYNNNFPYNENLNK